MSTLTVIDSIDDDHLYDLAFDLWTDHDDLAQRMIDSCTTAREALVRHYDDLLPLVVEMCDITGAEIYQCRKAILDVYFDDDEAVS